MSNDHDIVERHVRNTSAGLSVPLSVDQEDQAVDLAISWYDVARRRGIARADVDAAGTLVTIAVRAVRLAGPTPTAVHAPKVPSDYSELPVRMRGNRIIWFTTKQAAEHVGRVPETLRKALEAGELHGNQRKPGATWRIHADCLEAWLQGTPCPHVEGGGISS